MYTLLVTLIVVIAIMLAFIVVIQESKGGGLASGFASANAVAGVRQTTNFIEKATWSLAAALVVLSILCTYAAPDAATAGSVVENAATEQPAAANPNNVQGFGAAQQQGDAQEAPAAAPAQAAGAQQQ